MTMPSLIASHQKKSTVTAVMKAYSMLNQALKMYNAENGDEAELDFDTSLSAKNFGQKYFKPYLNVVKECTKATDGCWQTDDFNGYYDLTGVKKKNAIQYSMVLNNGMIVGVSKISGYNLISLVVDINGKKGKNTLGSDVFVFYAFNKNSLCGPAVEQYKNYNTRNGLYPGSFDDCGVPHVAFTREELLSTSRVCRSCNKTGSTCGDGEGGTRTGAGSACTAVIVKDGWNISDDYPWK